MKVRSLFVYYIQPAQSISKGKGEKTSKLHKLPASKTWAISMPLSVYFLPKNVSGTHMLFRNSEPTWKEEANQIINARSQLVSEENPLAMGLLGKCVKLWTGWEIH